MVLGDESEVLVACAVKVSRAFGEDVDWLDGGATPFTCAAAPAGGLADWRGSTPSAENSGGANPELSASLGRRSRGSM